MAQTFLHTPDSVIAAAAHHGLLLDAKSAKVSEAGLDFYAVFARDQSGTPWVVRSPRRSDVVERARHEAKVLKLVKEHLPVAVPDWRIHTTELIAYPLLAGVPAGEIDPEAKAYVWHIDPQNLLQPFVTSTAEVLAALHTIPSAAIEVSGLPTRTMTDTRTKIAGQFDQVRREFGVADALWARWQTWLANEDFWPKRATFVHGDFHAGHMLVDAAQRLSGVLDWTEGEVGDPTTDLAGYMMIFGEDALKQLLPAYAAAGGHVWPNLLAHAQETLAAYPAKVGLFAISSGIDEYKEMARTMLHPE